MNPQRVLRVDKQANGQGDQRNQQDFEQHNPWSNAGSRQLAQWGPRVAYVVGRSGQVLGFRGIGLIPGGRSGHGKGAILQRAPASPD